MTNDLKNTRLLDVTTPATNYDKLTCNTEAIKISCIKTSHY